MTNPPITTSAPIVPSDSAAAGVVTDIPPIRPDRRQIVRTFGISLVVLALVCAVAIPLAIVKPSGPVKIAAFIGLVMMCLAVRPLIMALVRRRVRPVLAEAASKDAPTQVMEYLKVTAVEEDQLCLKELMQQLVPTGRGMTFRICPPKAAVAIRPITSAFEPQPLDEGAASFQERESVLGASAAQAKLVGATPFDLADRLVGRKLTRFISLRGGWVFVLLAIGWSAKVAVDSWEAGRLTWSLLAWVSVLVAVCTVPTYGLIGPSTEWFVVPRGIVVRKARWRDRHWEVALFDRLQSVMVSCPHGLGQSWMVMIADGENVERNLMTAAEYVFLLSAWLSPLPPPLVERISDLA